MPELSVPQWAKSVGISKVAAYKRIKAGKVSLNANRKIDVDAANAEWERNKDALQQQRNASHSKSPPAAEPEAEKPPASGTLADAQREREWLRVRKERLALDQIEGKLISADDVRTATLNRSMEEKEALLNWPGRIAAALSGELGIDERRIHSILDREVKRFLSDRSSKRAAA